MRKYRHLLACYVPALAIAAELASTHSFASFAIGNMVIQAGLFAILAAVPAYRTGRMSYVDIAWPTGLTAIGLEVPVYARDVGPLALAIAAVYVAIGLRMSLPGIRYLVRHHRLHGEFGRYRYRRFRWEAEGWRGVVAPMQLEIWLQGLANASVLAVPAMLAAADAEQRLQAFQVAGLVSWVGCWSLEWLSDRQKRRFAARSERTATCNVGLWRYSRHPNYFFQWLGWVSLATAVTPALLHVARDSSVMAVAALTLALVGACAFMLWTLLELTGIKPAEHFSARKRPGYAEYQRTTRSFVPGPRRGDHRSASREEVHA